MEKNQTPNRKLVLILATLTSFLAPFMGASVNVALPLIGREFSMDAIVLSWISTAYLLAASALLVPFGRLADIYGRKKIFAFGIWDARNLRDAMGCIERHKAGDLAYCHWKELKAWRKRHREVEKAHEEILDPGYWEGCNVRDEIKEATP